MTVYPERLVRRIAQPSSPGRSPQPSDPRYDCSPRRPFVFSGLRTLFLFCRSFSHTDPLFPIACALFDRNTGGGIPPPGSSAMGHGLRRLERPRAQVWCNVKSFRINTCVSIASKQLHLPLESTLVKKPGEGGGGPKSASGYKLGRTAVHSGDGLVAAQANLAISSFARAVLRICFHRNESDANL
jgi:hypothetical protein